MRALLLETSFTKIVFWLMLLVASGAFADQHRGYALVNELKKGGYVVFIRHAGTDRADQDSDIRDLTQCATQRNLTEQGRNQSKLIGEGFAALKIPVGDIMTSEYCRCFDTAKIAFGHAQRVASLSSYVPLTAIEKQQRVQLLRRLLNVTPTPGTNTVIVSHHDMFQDASGLDLVEGEAAIFRPNTKTGPEFIARIRAEGWPNVVQQHLAQTQ